MSAISLPYRRRGLRSAVASRTALAVALLVLATVIVYLDADGYRDSAAPGRPLTLLASAYYTTVALSSTGFGDVVPVSSGARLINTFVITPMRVVFLIVVIGTTLEVLAERTRLNWEISRWRFGMSGHTVVVGYGTKGRRAISTLREAGTPPRQVVVVDTSPQAVAEANRAGLAGITGDATRREVLADAQVASARRLVIAVHQDANAVLIALTARRLSKDIEIIATVRESENEPLLRQSGCNHVVVSAEAAGRLLGLSTIDPAIGQVMDELLGRGRSLDLTERPASAAEVGRPARDAAAGTVAVLRDGQVLAIDDPRAGHVLEGDRFVLITSAPLGATQSGPSER